MEDVWATVPSFPTYINMSRWENLRISKKKLSVSGRSNIDLLGFAISLYSYSWKTMKYTTKVV